MKPCSTSLRLLSTCLTVATLLAGCSGDAHLKDRLQSSKSFAAGTEAFAKSQFEAAAEALTTAIDSGGLPVDSYCEALEKRAISYAQLKQFDLALADAKRLEQGAPDMAMTHAVRAFVFKKQGKLTEAEREMAIARCHNPQIKAIDDSPLP